MKSTELMYPQFILKEQGESKMNNEDDMLLEFIPADNKSILSAIERIQYYVEYYQTLLRYTKHSVRRNKIQEELDWWEQELVSHNEMMIGKLEE